MVIGERGGGRALAGGVRAVANPPPTLPPPCSSRPRPLRPHAAAAAALAAARMRAAAATAALASPPPPPPSKAGGGSGRPSAEGAQPPRPPPPPSDDNEDEDDDSPHPRGLRRRRRRRATATAAAAALALAAAAVGVGVGAPQVTLWGHAMWRWLALAALAPVDALACSLAVRAALAAAETHLLTTRGALYYLTGVRRWVERLARVGVGAAVFAGLFTPPPPPGPAAAAAAAATKAGLNIFACAAIACSASIAAAVGAKALAVRFYARAHFDAMQDALRKEFVVIALSVPRRRVVGGGGRGATATATVARGSVERSAVSAVGDAFPPRPMLEVERSCASASAAVGRGPPPGVGLLPPAEGATWGGPRGESMLDVTTTASPGVVRAQVRGRMGVGEARGALRARPAHPVSLPPSRLQAQASMVDLTRLLSSVSLPRYRAAPPLTPRTTSATADAPPPLPPRPAEGAPPDAAFLDRLHKVERHIRSSRLRLTFADALGAAAADAAADAAAGAAGAGAGAAAKVARTEARRLAFFLFWNVSQSVTRSDRRGGRRWARWRRPQPDDPTPPCPLFLPFQRLRRPVRPRSLPARCRHRGRGDGHAGCGRRRPVRGREGAAERRGACVRRPPPLPALLSSCQHLAGRHAVRHRVRLRSPRQPRLHPARRAVGRGEAARAPRGHRARRVSTFVPRRLGRQRDPAVGDGVVRPALVRVCVWQLDARWVEGRGGEGMGGWCARPRAPSSLSQSPILTFSSPSLPLAIYESVVYLFVTHPFDVGDIVVTGGADGGPGSGPHRVEEVCLLTTTLVRVGDGFRVTWPNARLAEAPLANLSRSGGRGDSARFWVDAGAAAAALEAATRGAETAAAACPGDFAAPAKAGLAPAGDAAPAGKIALTLFWRLTGRGDTARLVPARTALLAAVGAELERVGVGFRPAVTAVAAPAPP